MIFSIKKILLFFTFLLLISFVSANNNENVINYLWYDNFSDSDLSDYNTTGSWAYDGNGGLQGHGNWKLWVDNFWEDCNNCSEQDTYAFSYTARLNETDKGFSFLHTPNFSSPNYFNSVSATWSSYPSYDWILLWVSNGFVDRGNVGFQNQTNYTFCHTFKFKGTGSGTDYSMKYNNISLTNGGTTDFNVTANEIGFFTSQSTTEGYYTLDDFYIWKGTDCGTPPTPEYCYPDWVCDGYSTCNSSNLRPCNSVYDNNSCGLDYTGDYSELSGEVCDFNANGNIYTCEEFANIKNNTWNYNLMNDIDCQGIEFNTRFEPFFVGIDGFEGEFNGNGHIIYNLRLNQSQSYGTGVFGVIEEESYVHDVGFVNFTNDVTTGGYNKGGLARTLRGDVARVFMNGSIVARTNTNYGGLIGGTVQNSGTINDTYVDLKFTSTGSVARYGGVIANGNAGIYNRVYSRSNNYVPTPSSFQGLFMSTQSSGGCIATNIFVPEKAGWNFIDSGVELCTLTNATTKTFAQMHTNTTYTGFDFENVWIWNETTQFPDLRIFQTCVENWVCLNYSECMVGDISVCNQVNDINDCDTNYTGDYTEFGNQSCDYCTPDFVCSNYGSCNVSDLSPCDEVTDNNVCGENYTGDYLEFSAQACNYCSSDFQETGTTECVNDFRNVTYTDLNFATCCNVTLLSNDCDNPYSNQESCSDVFSYNAEDIGEASVDFVARSIIFFKTVVVIMLLLLLYILLKNGVEKIFKL